MKPEDRRAANVQRVALTTLVDICTQEGEISPFQGESANVSGRGMQVRTSYLPAVGEALICRLNHDDQEILVEGKVAWRSEGQDSGEFGIQFTALDADSAHVLQSLGETETAAESFLPPAITEEECEESDFVDGSRVKLHIEGLGAPMKACVHEGSTRKLRVGSSLDFLKVGRTLEIEDVEGGVRRGAHVDTVNVVINPSTSVPELVVQLRYEGMTPTPAPTAAVDFDDEAFSSLGASDSLRSVSMDHSVAGLDELDDDEPAPWEPAADAIRQRLGGAMASASQVAGKAGGLFSSAAKSAKNSVSSAVQGRMQHAREESTSLRSMSPQSTGVKRRQTTRAARNTAPSYLRSGIHAAGLAGKSRPSVSPSQRVSVSSRSSKQGGRGAEKVQKSATQRRFSPAMIFGVAFVVFGGSAFALRSAGSAEEAVASAESSLASEGAKKQETMGAIASKSSASAAKKKGKPEGVLAEVPLFGPQAMAVKPAEKPRTAAEEVKSEKRAAAAAVEDQTWEEEAPVQVKQSAPWGRGRLYLPTIHRIRLDGVGRTLSGAVNQDGFTVVVSGRKAMESGKSIQKRDKRIMVVKANNNARGATVRFEFRGPVPPYRVRLRKDFVEFLISAPQDDVAKL